MPGVLDGNQIIGVEVETVELQSPSPPVHNPYTGFAGNASIALGLGSGGGTTSTFPSTLALSIGQNPTQFATGIQFAAGGLFGDDGIHGAGEAIALGKGQIINWYAPDTVNCANPPTVSQPCGWVDAYIRSDSSTHNDPIGLMFTDGTLALNGTTSIALQIGTGQVAQGATLTFAENGVGKWAMQKDASNNFIFFDGTNNTNAFQINATNRQFTIGEGAPSSVVINAGSLGIVAVGQPSTPTSGFFFIYMDVADNKLKAKGPSGTVTTLANP